MTAWGFKNGHLEPWDFGHPGWMNERFSGFIISPVKDRLTCEVLAWTPATNGPVTGKAYQMILPEPDSGRVHGLPRDHKDKVKGKIVLVGKRPSCRSDRAPLRRQDDNQRRNVRSEQSAMRGQGRRRACRRAAATRTGQAHPRQIDERAHRRDAVAGGALVRVNDAGREHGQIRAFNNRTFDVGEGAADRRPAQRGLRPHRAHPRGRHAGRARVQHRQPEYPEGKTSYNDDRRDPGHGQERRSGDARRPPRFVALGDRRDRQRDRLRGDDGSRAHPEGDRREAAPHDSRRALGRRRAGPAGIARLT